MSEIVKYQMPTIELVRANSGSLTTVLDKNIKPISSHFRPGNKRNCITLIVEIVAVNLEAMGATNQLSGEAIALFASDFIQEFGSEKFEDLNLMFSYARRGKFGKDYNRIDSITLFTWFREYLELKYQEKERLKHNEKIQQNNELEKTSEVVKKQYLDKLKEIREELEEKNKPILSENKAKSDTLTSTYGDYLQELEEMPLETLKSIYSKVSQKWYKHQDGEYSHPDEIEIFMKRLELKEEDIFKQID